MSTQSPPPIGPPFTGYIGTTHDALIVFEAARLGKIPRVTRRLLDKERSMVQSGAVFVFDEHESGIKRWTDTLLWSPSRILGNFLVYRELERPNPLTPVNGAKDMLSPNPSSSASMQLPPGMSGFEPPPVLGSGALNRPRSASEGGRKADPAMMRQLVGSLTSSYNFKEGGLVKKTMSVNFDGDAQHLISYYTCDDVLDGRLRAPSSLPEFLALDISREYLHPQNFRFPPMVDVGEDGIPRYRGERDENSSPTSPSTGISPSFPTPNGNGNEAYLHNMYPPTGLPAPSPLHHQQFPNITPPQHLEPPQRHRSVTVPMTIPGSAGQSGTSPSGPGPSSLGSGNGRYYDLSLNDGNMVAPPIVRQSSHGSANSASGVMRPNSSSRRFDPYAPPSSSSPRLQAPPPPQAYHSRRASQPVLHPGTSLARPYDYYSPPATAGAYDPIVKAEPPQTPNPFHYHPPQTAPGSFGDFYTSSQHAHPLQQQQQQPLTHHLPPMYLPQQMGSPTTYSPSNTQYATWQPPPGSGPVVPREYTSPIQAHSDHPGGMNGHSQGHGMINGGLQVNIGMHPNTTSTLPPPPPTSHSNRPTSSHGSEADWANGPALNTQSMGGWMDGKLTNHSHSPVAVMHGDPRAGGGLMQGYREGGEGDWRGVRGNSPV